jgi:hypothetical protein
MIHLNLNVKSGEGLKILCMGAHSDDIEIGCGGTILRLAEQYPKCEFHWVVFNAIGARETEAKQAAELFAGSRLKSRILKTFQDGFMPYMGSEVKAIFEKELNSQLTWNTFRDHFILEYEIPKYDGDLGRPSIFVPLERELSEKKVGYLMEAFQSQQTKHWFQQETFLSLMRLRGMECAASSGYAEAFYCRKLVM